MAEKLNVGLIVTLSGYSKGRGYAAEARMPPPAAGEEGEVSSFDRFDFHRPAGEGGQDGDERIGLFQVSGIVRMPGSAEVSIVVMDLGGKPRIIDGRHAAGLHDTADIVMMVGTMLRGDAQHGMIITIMGLDGLEQADLLGVNLHKREGQYAEYQ